MFDKKISSQSILDFVLICLLSLTYAGISSGVFFGFRVVDILIVLGLVYKSRTKIGLPTWVLLGLWFVSIVLSSFMGIIEGAPYLVSDLRFFVVFALGVLLAITLAKNKRLKIEYIYYALIIGTLIIYHIIPHISFIRFYYIPESFQSEEHLNTIFGPSTVLISYLFIYLVFKDRNRHFLFYLSYLLAAILIFRLRISRQDLIIMLLLFAWSIGYRLIYRIRLTYLLVIAAGSVASLIFIVQSDNERIKGITNPTKDTSYNYRAISNADFLEKYKREPAVTKAIGFGMGSTFIFHYNEYLGRRELNILDNTPLTILLKSGYLGLFVYILIVLYPMIYLNWHQRVLLLFPIVLSMFLFNHALYNVLYIFGVYFVAFRLKEQRMQNTKLLNS